MVRFHPSPLGCVSSGIAQSGVAIGGGDTPHSIMARVVLINKAVTVGANPTMGL